MKIDRHGRAKILTVEEIQLLFSEGLTNSHDRALFGIMLFTACRVREACTLLTGDVYEPSGKVRSELIFRKGNTKGKLATRTIPVLEDLRLILTSYKSEAGEKYLFPGRFGSGHIHSDSAARILRKACIKVGILGASTHSFRRTALTQMSDMGIPLRIIQEVSGHRNLSQLQKYLEVRPEQVRGAIASLSMLSPTAPKVVKPIFAGLLPGALIPQYLPPHLKPILLNQAGIVSHPLGVHACQPRRSLPPIGDFLQLF